MCRTMDRESFFCGLAGVFKDVSKFAAGEKLRGEVIENVGKVWPDGNRAG